MRTDVIFLQTEKLYHHPPLNISFCEFFRESFVDQPLFLHTKKIRPKSAKITNIHQAKLDTVLFRELGLARGIKKLSQLANVSVIRGPSYRDLL